MTNFKELITGMRLRKLKPQFVTKTVNLLATN